MVQKIPVKEAVETAIDVTKWSQIVTLIKENQLAAALGLFILWQTGALLAVFSQIQGGMC